MSTTTVILIFLAYLATLFGLAGIAERSRGKTKRWSYAYALSLTVYCTAWTFMGSVGRAANNGISFLPIYLGPLMLAPVWPILIRKIIRICKAEKLTSLPDFISSRYGRSRTLGLLAALFLVIGVVPYISIQLKAIASIFSVLTGEAPQLNDPFYSDTALLLTILLAVFIMIFGVRRLDPNQSHNGIMAAISFEAIFKLFAFLLVGGFITFGVFSGFGDLFEHAQTGMNHISSWSVAGSGLSGWDWFWLNFVSMCAVVLLPRQFHVAVVENQSDREVRKAAWFFPVYLLLINIFVIPIAIAGVVLNVPGGLAGADSFVISIPQFLGYEGLAIIAALGGFAAVSGMVIMSTIALSIMIGNNIVLPYLLRSVKPTEQSTDDLSQPLLRIRRLIILLVLLLAYAYYRGVAAQFSLVAIGLVSFTAVAQFAPVVLAGLYWQGAARKGAKWGLIAGFIVWAYTLAVPTVLGPNPSISQFLSHGPWGIEWLKPQALFGMEGVNPIAHGAFWSLLANTTALVLGSIYYVAKPIDITQADFFVNHHKYINRETEDYRLRRRQARVGDLSALLARFVGPAMAKKMFHDFARQSGESSPKANDNASPALLLFTEKQLAGAVGSAASQTLLKGIIREEPVQLEEVIGILKRTHDAVRYGRELERKQEELEALTTQLRSANRRLQELDKLKADFISTVTHELRTPITSVKSLANILIDSPQLKDEQRLAFLRVIVSESERLARLVSQVLDLQKIEAKQDGHNFQLVNLNELIESSVSSLAGLAKDKGIDISLELPGEPLYTFGPKDRLTQVMVNLVGNAIKFVAPNYGRVQVELGMEATEHLSDSSLALIKVKDNGPGIAEEQRQFIFEQFTQISNQEQGKPHGSGLGLYISKRIVEQCGGGLSLDSQYQTGACFLLRLPNQIPTPHNALSKDTKEPTKIKQLEADQ
ncbi:MAG: sensor histidine kinase [Bacteroidota bacterium]